MIATNSPKTNDTKEIKCYLYQLMFCKYVTNYNHPPKINGNEPNYS